VRVWPPDVRRVSLRGERLVAQALLQAARRVERDALREQDALPALLPDALPDELRAAQPVPDGFQEPDVLRAEPPVWRLGSDDRVHAALPQQDARVRGALREPGVPVPDGPQARDPSRCVHRQAGEPGVRC
jgi:hypothetical protein